MVPAYPVTVVEIFEEILDFEETIEVVAEAEDEVIGAMIVGIEIVIWIENLEVLGTTAARHSEMTDPMIEIGGVEMIILEDAGHHHPKVEADRQTIDLV